MTDEGNGKRAGLLRKEDIEKEIREIKLIKHHEPENIQACSYDMRVGTIYINKKKYTPDVTQGTEVTLDPGAIINILTEEELKLPDDIAATAFAINSLSSEGLLVLNPGHIDPGFEGPLTVTAINLRATSKVVLFSTPIFTVIFERLPQPTNYPFKYNKTREQLEQEFYAKHVEQNPESLYRLVTIGKDKPLMTAQEVDNRIRSYWLTWIVTITSVVAAIFAILAVFKDDDKTSSPVNITIPATVQQANTNQQPALNGPNSLNQNINNNNNNAR